MTEPSMEDFFDQPPAAGFAVMNGNSPWAQRYSWELRDVVVRFASRLPRSMQRHLGPSELGHNCDRQLVGKMAGVSFGSSSNTMHDPWASIVGTAIHALLEEAFTWDAAPPDPEKLDMENGKNLGRWLAENRVTPDPGAEQPHPGTADLYDNTWKAVVDHKAQSEGVRGKLKSNGPPRHYFAQLLLYATGYMLQGAEVEKIVLVSWPRTKSTLEEMYVWEHTITNEDLQLVIDVLKKTEVREKLAVLVHQGAMDFMDVPATPSEEDCQYCPFYNPRAGRVPGAKGCPGMELLK